VTNVPEGGLWIESVNLLYGRTNNPWDLRRTAGGSSGGEAAIIAAGGSPFGLGSDIGGSIRVPAAFCGIFGHKPTGGLVPNTGQFPGALGGAGAYLVSGPMARRAKDLMPLLRVLAGPDGEDPHCRDGALGDPAAVDLRDVVVYPLPTNGRTSVRRSMRWAVEHAAHALRHRGARVVELRVPRLRRAFEIWAGMMSAANEVPYAQVLGDGEPLQVVRELLRVPLGSPRYTTIALVLAGLDGLVGRVPGLARRFVAEGLALRAELEEALGPNGVLLHPPYTRSAPPHGAAWRAPLDPACTCIFNVLEMPVTQVPLSFDGEGLPVGVQVVGARGRDHVTIAAAQALESAFGGWTRADPRPLS
jgi:fatty acid amide hydrolase 2